MRYYHGITIITQKLYFRYEEIEPIKFSLDRVKVMVAKEIPHYLIVVLA
jgi:hypothetical protein